jgi:ElaB/YqjD/DUF883 family membrane-anchored ribosome-binding protein
MAEDKTLTSPTAAKRKQTKQKVEAGEARNRAKQEPSTLDRAGETALEAKDRFTEFAKEHPIAVVAGGLALGILVSGLFRGSPTRKAAEKVGNRAASLATVGAELAMAYAAQAMAAADEAGRTGASKLSELGASLSETALDVSKSTGDTASEVARTAGKRIARALHGRFN